MDFVCLFSIIIMETRSRNQIRICTINARKNNTHSYSILLFCKLKSHKHANFLLMVWLLFFFSKHSILGDRETCKRSLSRKLWLSHSIFFRMQCLRKLLVIVFLERHYSFYLPINIAFNNGRCTLR